MGYSLGIDVGTAFTAAAIVRDGRAETVALGNHAATIPSVVFLREDATLLIGDAAERRGLQEPARMALEFKRRFGDAVPILLDRTPFSADRLTTAILRMVLDDVVRRQGGEPDAVAIAHPANWGGFKVDLLRQAVENAGINDATFVTEPVAAAVQYASTERVDVGDTFVVYDLGGGTFDAAVLRKTADGFETLGRPQGIERLGGIDFDEAVVAHVRRTVGDALEQLDTSDPAVRPVLAHLREECIEAKESLSSDSDATVAVLLPNLQTQVRITRVEFEDMIRPMLRETIDATKRAIAGAHVETSSLKAVLLAGGSSRIPLIGEMLRTEFERAVVTDSHPKHAVALGAARVAAAAPPSTVVAPLSPPVAPVASPPLVAPPPVMPAPAPEPSVVVPDPTPAAVARPTTTAEPVPVTAVRRRRSNTPLVIALGLVTVAAIAVSAVVLLGGDSSGTATTQVATTVPSSPTAAAPTTTVVTSGPAALPTVPAAVQIDGPGSPQVLSDPLPSGLRYDEVADSFTQSQTLVNALAMGEWNVARMIDPSYVDTADTEMETTYSELGRASLMLADAVAEGTAHRLLMVSVANTTNGERTDLYCLQFTVDTATGQISQLVGDLMTKWMAPISPEGVRNNAELMAVISGSCYSLT